MRKKEERSVCSVDVIIFYVPRPTFVFSLRLRLKWPSNYKRNSTKKDPSVEEEVQVSRERAPKAFRIDLGVSGRHPKFAVLISAANELSPLVA